MVEPSTTSKAIGIDLGTTFSCVGVWKDGRVQIIPNSDGYPITPSYVAFSEDGLVEVGDQAKNIAIKNVKNVVFDAKRMIGRNFSDPVVQEDMRLWPFKVIQGQNDRPVIEVQKGGQTKQFSPEEISAMVLSKMKQIAEKFLNRPVEQAVITVPAYFNDQQKNATKDAATLAKLNVLRVISEPTAAAVAYGIDRMSKKEKKVLIYDFGGGTLDVSVLSLEGSKFEVLATSGNTHLGGEDIDQALVNHCIEEFRKENTDFDPEQQKRSIRRLKSLCERAKILLSVANETQIEAENFYEGNELKVPVKRDDLEQIAKKVFDKCIAPIDDALKVAKLTREKIDEIVLVGGSTKIPYIQQLVKNYFNKVPFTGINPDQAIAYGAAIQAAFLSGLKDPSFSNFTILDCTPLSLGIQIKGGLMSVIIQRATPIPIKKTKQFTTSEDDQEEVGINVYEGESQLVSECNFLGSFTLAGIPKAPKETPQIDVTFYIDENQLLKVKAVEKSVGSNKQITIKQPKGRFTDEQLDEMIKKAKKMQKEEALIVERIVAKNELESVLGDTKKKFEQLQAAAKLDDPTAQMIRQKLETVSNWLLLNQKTEAKYFQARKSELKQLYEDLQQRAQQ